MPLFFIISGAGYYLQTKGREYSFVDILKNKGRGILWPYFVFSMINIPMLMVMDYLTVGYSNRDISDLLLATLYGNLGYKSMPTGPLWFCLVLFLTTILFYIIRRICQKDWMMAGITVLVGAAGYLVTKHYSAIIYPWYSNVTFMAVIFFLLGYLFMKNISVVRKITGDKERQASLFVILLFAGFLCARYNTKISMAVSSYGSFILFFGSVIGFSAARFICCPQIFQAMK